MLETLKSWDAWLFLKINHDWTNGFLDSVFPWWRDAVTWAPLYLFLLVFILTNFGLKAWPWVVTLILTVVITDQGSNIIKDIIARPRPCNDVVFGQYVRLLLNRCPSSYSFTSNHAANHFGAAFVLYFTLKPYIKKWGYLFFVWAATVAYGQMYVGVHYPLDILGGTIFGAIAGSLMAYIFNKFIGLTGGSNQKAAL
ncbi:MAG TPA: phosphatase PAP2 family protein [Chitinophagaceae bacterium]|nr:phosphatase PAP2 family protein [Chitinophagaceae bacterium]